MFHCCVSIIPDPVLVIMIYHPDMSIMNRSIIKSMDGSVALNIDRLKNQSHVFESSQLIAICSPTIQFKKKEEVRKI